MAETRYTDETVELVAQAIHGADCEWSWEDCRTERTHNRAACDVLDAQATAGLLVPPGGEVDEQFGIRWTWSNGHTETFHRPEHIVDRVVARGVQGATPTKARREVRLWDRGDSDNPDRIAGEWAEVSDGE